MGWDELLWFKVGEACNVKVIWTHAGETFLCDIFDIWQRLGSCKANRSSFSQILPVDSCIFDDQLDTRDCQGRSGPFVTIRQMGPSLALQICAMFSFYPFWQLDEPLYVLRAYSIWCMCLNMEQSLNIPFLQFKSFALSKMSAADWALITLSTSIILTTVGFQKIRSFQSFPLFFWTEYACFQTIRIPSRCLWSLALWITKNGFLHLQITNAEAASQDDNGIQTVANKISNYLVSAN